MREFHLDEEEKIQVSWLGRNSFTWRKVQTIYGPLENCPNYTHEYDGCGKYHLLVDSYIAKLIFILNKKGFITTNHCSGLKEDHGFEGTFEDLRDKKYFEGLYEKYGNGQDAAKSTIDNINSDKCPYISFKEGFNLGFDSRFYLNYFDNSRSKCAIYIRSFRSEEEIKSCWDDLYKIVDKIS